MDASDESLGAVLVQKDNNGFERVIFYHSRSLTDHEEGYSATEKEALPVVYPTDYFHPYPLGKKFAVVPEHSALHWLHSVEPKRTTCTLDKVPSRIRF